MVLEFSSNNSERIVKEMMIDMNFRQPVGGTWGYPFFIQVVVYHNRGSGRGYTLLRSFVTENNNNILISECIYITAYYMLHKEMNQIKIYFNMESGQQT